MAISVSRAKSLDFRAREKLGISTLVLMENAGRAVASIAEEMLKKGKLRQASLFCGRGNNGGDGFVAARHLISKGFSVKVYLAAKKKELKGEALANFNILKKSGAKIYEIHSLADLSKLKQRIRSAGLIIDALLGIGLAGKVREPIASLIEFLNTTRIPILSVDTPSGLDADRGTPCGCAIRAKATVSFVDAKDGFLLRGASEYTGKVYVADIGFPQQLII